MNLSKQIISRLSSDASLVKASAPGTRIQEWNKAAGSAIAQIRAIISDLKAAGIEPTSVKKSMTAGVKASLPGFARDLDCWANLSDAKKASFNSQWTTELKGEGEDKPTVATTWQDYAISMCKKAAKSEVVPSTDEILAFVLATIEQTALSGAE